MTARPSDPEDVLATYEAGARMFQHERDVSGFEAPWLERAWQIRSGQRVLDLGCGAGAPIATWFASQGAQVTGVDGSAAMIRLFQEALPEATAHVSDMRTLALDRQFDVLIAWNSFFHLPPDDQRSMFPIFAAHAAPGAALLFTSGPGESEVWGTAAGRPVYHASLAPNMYRRALTEAGFEVVAFTPEDPECRGHTVWLAQYQK